MIERPSRIVQRSVCRAYVRLPQCALLGEFLLTPVCSKEKPIISNIVVREGESEFLTELEIEPGIAGPLSHRSPIVTIALSYSPSSFRLCAALVISLAPPCSWIRNLFVKYKMRIILLRRSHVSCKSGNSLCISAVDSQFVYWSTWRLAILLNKHSKPEVC